MIALAALVTGVIAAATPSPAARSAVTAGAVVGCLDQWLSDGIWRFRVTKIAVKTVEGRRGYGVTVEIGNESTAVLTPMFTGADAREIVLQIAGGKRLTTKATNEAARIADALSFHELKHGEVLSLELVFLDLKVSEIREKPMRVVYPVNPAIEAEHRERPQYTVANPSFEVDVTC
jgi:hypothetical protein